MEIPPAVFEVGSTLQSWESEEHITLKINHIESLFVIWKLKMPRNNSSELKTHYSRVQMWDDKIVEIRIMEKIN